MGLQRTLADASGRSVTEPKRLIRKRPGTSRRATSPCQGGCRGFDPRFPLHTSLRPLRLDFALRAHQLRGFAPAARASSPLGDFARRDRGKRRS